MSRLVRSGLYCLLSCLFFHTVVVLYGAPILEWVLFLLVREWEAVGVGGCGKETYVKYDIWAGKTGFSEVGMSYLCSCVSASLLYMWVFQVCLRDLLSGSVADHSNHAEMPVCPWPQHPSLDTSIQQTRVRPRHSSSLLKQCVLLWLCPCWRVLVCFQGYVCMGYFSSDHSGLYCGRSMARSFPHTPGLGETMAGQYTHTHTNRHTRTHAVYVYDQACSPSCRCGQFPAVWVLWLVFWLVWLLPLAGYTGIANTLRTRASDGKSVCVCVVRV